MCRPVVLLFTKILILLSDLEPLKDTPTLACEEAQKSKHMISSVSPGISILLDSSKDDVVEIS